MDDSRSVPYVFITLLGTGMPWSEQEEGRDFLEWACSCFAVEADEFSWMEDPGEQQMEFTTALPTRAGVNALVKPRSACWREHPEGMRPAPCGRLSLRNVKAKGGHRPLLYQAAPSNLNKLWVAQRVACPLEMEPADRESFFRPHPDNLHVVFPTFEVEAAVRSACNTMLDWEQGELTRQIKAAPPNKKQGLHQTGIYLNALVELANWSGKRPSPQRRPRRIIFATEFRFFGEAPGCRETPLRARGTARQMFLFHREKLPRAGNAAARLPQAHGFLWKASRDTPAR